MAARIPTDPDALRRIGQMPEGRLVAAVLRDRLAVYDEKLRRAIGVDLHVTQGRAVELEDILGMLDPDGAARPVPKPTMRSIKGYRVNHMAD